MLFFLKINEGKISSIFSNPTYENQHQNRKLLQKRHE